MLHGTNGGKGYVREYLEREMDIFLEESALIHEKYERRIILLSFYILFNDCWQRENLVFLSLFNLL